MAPDYICKLINPKPLTDYALRSNRKFLLKVPNGEMLTALGARAFAFDAPNLWNDLPSEISGLVSLSGFKRTLKTYLFKRAFNCVVLLVYTLTFNITFIIFVNLIFITFYICKAHLIM